MDLREAATHAKNGNAVVFLGAGFSRGALNSGGEEILSSTGLARKLLDEINIGEPLELSQAANIYERAKDRILLRNCLLRAFAVRTPSEDHIAFCEGKWDRIYTTNYDDVVEVALSKTGISNLSLLASTPTSTLTANAVGVIHLHGSVRAIMAGSPNDDIILTSADYAADMLASSPWLPAMRSDLITSRAIIFVGYSLQDLDIARLLARAADMRDKIIFVSAPDEPDHVVQWLSSYGTPIRCGLKGFVEALGAAPTALETDSPEFTALTEIKVVGTPQKATPDDAIGLFGQGHLNPSIFAHERAVGSPYSITRFGERQILNALNNGTRKFVVHADFGNGKTIFLRQISQVLAAKGYAVFQITRKHATIAAEIRRLLSLPTPVCLVADNIFRFSDELRIFSNSSRQDNVILTTTRTIQFEIDSDELDSIVGGGAVFIDLNRLSSTEQSQIDSIYEEFGLWGGHVASKPHQRIKIISDKCDAELRSFMLWSFENGSIAEKILGWTAAVEKFGDDTTNLVAAILMIQMTGFQFWLDEICDLMRLHHERARRQLQQSDAQELISLRGWQIDVRSPILAEFVLKRAFSGDTCEKVLLRIVRSLNEIGNEGGDFADLMRELMRLRFVGSLFGGPDRDAHILTYYSAISAMPLCRSNPQFWLQYAMARMQREQYSIAQKCFDSAYQLAGLRRGYNTFQIDNQYGSFLLLSRARGEGYTDLDASALKACQLVNKQIASSRSRDDHYPFKVVPAMAEFWSTRQSSIQPNTIAVLNNTAKRLMSRLEAYNGSQLSQYEIGQMKEFFSSLP